ncbi:MAG TPA: ATP-binding protein [Vicinamibacterales bacterium]|nr:ATP-binding protein [Vicinamibacterales bacterium]
MYPDSRSGGGGRRRAFALSALGVAAALVVELLIARSPATRLSLTPFSLSVALAVWLGGFGPGIFALLLSALAIDFYFVGPGTLLDFRTSSEAAVLFIYVTGWLGFCVIADRVHRRNERGRQRRVDAERASRQATRIAELTAALAQARTPAAVIDASVQEPMHALGADAALFLLVSAETGALEVARTIGYESTEREARGRAAAAASKGAASDAVERGAPVLVETRDALVAEYGPRPDRELRAIAAIPLLVGSRVVAVIQLEFHASRFFTADDREYLFTLAPRAAQTLDRAWQHEAALRARADAEALRARADQELTDRQEAENALRASETRYRALAARTSRLHDLTAAMSEAVTLEGVAKAIVRHGRIAVGATSGELQMLVENGTVFETLDRDGDAREPDRRRRMAVEPGLCATEAVETRQPVFVASFSEWQQRYSRSASIAAGGGYASVATLPLLVEGRAIGVLAFHFTVPVNFDDEYRALLVSVAQHCAQAVDRARLYEAAQHARAEAETANRLKDEFVSLVSHELRTPLNAMLGWTAMLQQGAVEPAITTRALQSIHDNATRQARLIDELLDFSRIVSGRMKLDIAEVDLRRLLRGVIESMIPSAAASGVELDVATIPSLKVTGDAGRLEQVFFNLIGNAIKFTPRGGRIGLDVRPDGDVVEIRVSDTGAGIPPEFLPHVFDRFRQADDAAARAHGGLGLGLSIVRELVEAHRGRVHVESAGRGHGSTFTVTLPLSTAAVILPEPADSASVPVPARLDGVRVLVVDDEADARQLMAVALEECGAAVSQAGSAHDALTLLEGGDVDVLLADLVMPQEDGIALIRKVRASSAPNVASIPAAAVSGRTRQEERREALAAGFHVHVSKPVDAAQLADTVARLVRGNATVH